MSASGDGTRGTSTSPDPAGISPIACTQVGEDRRDEEQYESGGRGGSDRRHRETEHQPEVAALASAAAREPPSKGSDGTSDNVGLL